MHTCAFSSLRGEGNQPKALGGTIPSEQGPGSSKKMGLVLQALVKLSLHFWGKTEL